MAPKILFEEKQYLGFNTYSISRRMVLAIFCFVAYYYTEDRERNADLLFLVGIFILIVSVILLFVKYLHIKVTEGSVILKGMWSTRLVKIDLSAIATAEKGIYSKYHLNNPAFNVHVSNTIKFYAGGSDALKLTDKEGLVYLIGTHKADEFLRAVKESINKQQ
jgi:hypothetical protein